MKVTPTSPTYTDSTSKDKEPGHSTIAPIIYTSTAPNPEQAMQAAACFENPKDGKDLQMKVTNNH